jgi:sulfur-oxidizing protein SoxZ
MSDNDSGRIRARLRDGKIEVRVLLRHPMETGARKHPDTGALVPRHFIREVICEHNGTKVLSLDWGWGISTDPYLGFWVEGGSPGDRITVRWSDNQGESGRVEGVVS